MGFHNSLSRLINSISNAFPLMPATTLFHISWMLRGEKTGIKHINEMQIDPTLLPTGVI
jgi:hypothetical protein